MLRPAVLFGLRVWASVCLALYVAFALQLENPYWAGLTAAIVCQPRLGASLRKGAFRMLGTVIGAVFIVVLTALFPQDRVGFLLGLALWGAACAFVATLLRNFASYAAALAGYTAAVIAMDALGAVGGPGGDTFMLAVMRATEICLGIVCAGVVLVATDFGGARHRLSAQIASLATMVWAGVVAALRLSGPAQAATRETRRDLVRRVVALGPDIDEAVGESSDLRYRSDVLQRSTDGLLQALSAWRDIANHLERETSAAEAGAEIVLAEIPPDLRLAAATDALHLWTTAPARIREECLAAAGALAARPVRTPSARLLADRTGEALLGLAQTLDAMALLVDDAVRLATPRRTLRLHVPDWLPPVVNAGRAFVTIGATALVWIVTAWPNGALAMTFATVGVILFSPQAEQAYARTVGWMLGSYVSAVLAAGVKFAILPHVETFAGLCLAIGLVLVPGGTLAALPWQSGVFVSTTANFIPLLSPANVMTYDLASFLNTALGIVGGASVAALAFLLMPPLPAGLRTRRLLRLTLRDLRRLAAAADHETEEEWDSRIYARIFALPDSAAPAERAQLVAALSLGPEIIRLRRIGAQLQLGAAVDAALAALARGSSADAIDRLARVDEALATTPPSRGDQAARLRGRGIIVTIAETLAQHVGYFDQPV